jgi:uncharacterized glyoxalase superfamily protein PhnB
MKFTAAELLEAVPFFHVSDMRRSLEFYVDRLGFEKAITWEPEGMTRWCRLEMNGVAIMLQLHADFGQADYVPLTNPGQGLSISFTCKDALALYHHASQQGLQPSIPFVGNGMWVTTLLDPDGYRLEFESLTDAAEGTTYVPSG